ncbi:MAG: hypothetical protein AAGA18_04670 [Verrucomicrobiota bacterium]
MILQLLRLKLGTYFFDQAPQKKASGLALAHPLKKGYELTTKSRGHFMGVLESWVNLFSPNLCLCDKPLDTFTQAVNLEISEWRLVCKQNKMESTS